MDQTSIYGNPTLSEPKFLFVQLSQVRKLTINGHRAVINEFRVQPFSENWGGSFLYASLYLTPKAEKLWPAFRKTFGFDGYEPQTALNNWGKVYLTSSHWKQAPYSTIHFVAQTDIDKQKVAKLARLSEMNIMPWDARDPDEAAEMVREALVGREDDERIEF